MYVENIGKYINEKMNEEVCRGNRDIQFLYSIVYISLINHPIYS